MRDLSAESEACPLRLPVQRKAFLETVERQGRGHIAVGDGLHDIGGQEGQADDAGDVSPVQFFLLRQLRQGQDNPRFELLNLRG